MKIATQLLTLVLVGFELIAADPAKSVFQIRLVLESAAADTEPMTISRWTKDQEEKIEEIVHVHQEVLMDQRAVASARVHRDVISGQHQIEITFTDKDRRRFAEVTREHIGRRLAIVVDGQILSAPKIASEISGGKAAISGNFSEKEAADLAAKINAAAKR